MLLLVAVCWLLPLALHQQTLLRAHHDASPSAVRSHRRAHPAYEGRLPRMG
jgi:hypothetical protein|eukprot:SAG25_NODE_1708_length_2501_cov_2.734388_2_plen_51_part_00